MAGRREIERRLHALRDIDTILGVMKNLALMEAGKLSRILVAQHDMVKCLGDTAADFLRFYPQPQRSAVETNLLLVIGSQRGLCGDFNDLLLAALTRFESSNFIPLKIVIGAKLTRRIPADTYLEGPHSVEEISQVIHAVMNEINSLLNRVDGGHPLQLSALYNDPDTGIADVRPLTPFLVESSGQKHSGSFAPYLTMAPAAFYANVTEQHLLASITELFHRSLMAESRFRLNHIEGASHRIERRADELKRKQSMVRQEEIIEEIEAILAGVGLEEVEAGDEKTAPSASGKRC